ncbi:MAG: 50S ribosomal protein L6 [SAR324 cluster bacterium]|nr:50S ribosomal protein L6 [SAR324 cluster bacterium]
MSRIGKRPIVLTENVNISYKNRELEVKGPKGTLKFVVPDLVDLDIQEKNINVQADYENDKKAKALMGTTQALISNMVTGVSQGFQKQLNLVGVGYRAAVTGNKLELNLGFSHPIHFELPEGVQAKVEANTKILLESCDKQLIGQVAANIRVFRPPEPYKGKGILFEGEQIRRKAGKSAKV